MCAILSNKNTSATPSALKAILARTRDMEGLEESAFRDDQVFLSRLADQSGRYEDMVDHVNRLVTVGQELTLDERGLFSLAYRNTVGARRSAWRALAALEHKEASTGGIRGEKAQQIRSYRQQIEEEISKYCKQIIALIDATIIPSLTTLENKVFYYKLKGDYTRYIAEITAGEEHRMAVENTHECYKIASDVALSQLSPTHPTRLGLALNFSVFYYEILNSPERACLLAKAAFDDALAVMDGLDEDSYKDAATLMQLLRDNLALWTADMVPSVNTNN
jgi:14-3-3 protein epsilon